MYSNHLFTSAFLCIVQYFPQETLSLTEVEPTQPEVNNQCLQSSTFSGLHDYKLDFGICIIFLNIKNKHCLYMLTKLKTK